MWYSAKHLATVCPCPEDLFKAELKCHGLMCFVDGIFRQDRILRLPSLLLYLCRSAVIKSNNWNKGLFGK